MKTNVKTSLLALFVVSLITLGTYMVQAEEAGVLPPEPIIEVAEIIPPVPELLETESGLLPSETITDLGTSTPGDPLNIEVTEPVIDTVNDNEPLPTDLVIEETAIESEVTAEENRDLEIAAVSETVETTENVPVLLYPKFPYSLEDTSDDHLPTVIQECFGGGFRDFSRPFASPGECLQYVRSL